MLQQNTAGRRSRIVAGVLAGAMTMGLAWQGVAAATPDRADVRHGGIVQALPSVADPVGDLAQRKAGQFQSAVAALTPYVTVSDTGVDVNVPDHVVRELDAEVVAALRQAAAVDQISVAGDVEAAAIWPIIREFVKRYWSRIVDAAKRAGVWAWYKAHICAGGAGQALYVFSGGNPAVIAANPEGALAAAISGCIKALR